MLENQKEALITENSEMYVPLELNNFISTTLYFCTYLFFMSVVIKVDNLSKKFKDFTAVNNLSFTVNKGDVYGFLGQNGAGKSTTIRMLLTLIKPTTGNITIFEKNLLWHFQKAFHDCREL
jgi:ABC-type uncharacterized transport system ATPase subunit